MRKTVMDQNSVSENVITMSKPLREIQMRNNFFRGKIALLF